MASRPLNGLVLLLMAAAAAASAANPRPLRPASNARPTAAPTAQAVRALHKMVLDEDISDAGAEEILETYLRARGGRTEPIWANHTHAERTANLQHARRRSANEERRRMQMGQYLFAGMNTEDQESNLVATLGPVGSVCDDPLAVNTGQPLPCDYSCEQLKDEYFPAPQAQTTRCFLFDPATETWPEAGGQGAELLDMRQQRYETHTYIGSEDGEGNPAASSISWSVGKGRVCQNVTIRTMMMMVGVEDGPPSHTEELCLLDGEHEYNHTLADEHSIEVVGYVESELQPGAGGQTPFVIGECTDVLIRVTTTSSGGGSVTWSLDDGGHNGPWTFESSEAVHEFETCQFANDFTLTRQPGSSWEGTVEVMGFVHYHNTITIPTNENWIVQGIVDPASGLPASLNARFKSGTAFDRSHAGIVLRHLRISGQVAPVDVNPIDRNGFVVGMTEGYGGAFEYGEHARLQTAFSSWVRFHIDGPAFRWRQQRPVQPREDRLHRLDL
eukprot:COSAG04_NODE_715_length_10861_cov_4.115406_5_plen_500_part_00